MSHQDDQKQHEFDCLKYALNVKSDMCFGDLDMLRYFRYPDVDGFTYNRPDFVKMGFDDGEPVVVGIEHFDVDMMSRIHYDRKSSKIAAQSVTSELEKYDSMNAYEWCQAQDDFKKKIPNVLLLDKMFEWVENVQKLKQQRLEVGSHRSLLLSYETGIGKHAGNNKLYKNNMDDFVRAQGYGSCSLKLFWFINVYAMPYRMMIANAAETLENVVYPLTVDVLSLFTPHAVRYLSGIVICVRDSLYDNGANLFCLSSEMLQHGFDISDVPVCVYVGADAEIIDAYSVDGWPAFVDKKQLSKMLKLKQPQMVNVPLVRDICDTFSDRGRYAFLESYSYFAACHAFPYKRVYPLLLRMDLYSFTKSVFDGLICWKCNHPDMDKWDLQDECYFVDKIFCQKGLLVCDNLAKQGLLLEPVRQYLTQVLSDFENYKSFPNFCVTDDRVVFM